MAKVDELSRKQEADRRAALLGLAADKKPVRRVACLTSLEMSAFLEERSSFEQQEAYLAHFSSCDSCYREWLELQLELSCDTSAAQKPLLFRRKVLAVAGSLLATAASVILYLNLEQGPTPFETPPLSVPQADMALQKRVETTSSPVPQKAAKEVAVPSSKDSDPYPFAMPVESMEHRKGMPSTRMDRGGRSFSVPSEQTAAPPMEAQELRKQWLQRVEESCSHQHTGLDEWRRLAQQGRELLSETKFMDLSALVAHLEGLVKGKKQETVCAEIKRLLKDTNDD